MCRYDESCSWDTKTFVCDRQANECSHPGWEHTTSWKQVQASLAETSHIHDVDGDAVTTCKVLKSGDVKYTYAYGDGDGGWTEGEVGLDGSDTGYLLAPNPPISEAEMAEVLAALGAVPLSTTGWGPVKLPGEDKRMAEAEASARRTMAAINAAGASSVPVVLVDTSPGDPQFTRVHGPFASEPVARGVAVSTGEGGRLDDTLWVVPLTGTFP